jgi:prophage DNA circulation protein
MSTRGYNESDFRPASFRGVPFVVQVVESELARRNVDHQVTDGQDFAEDTGEELGRYSLTAVVIGPGYLERGEALRAAIRAGDAGPLVHPLYGTRSVVIDKVRERFGGKLGALEYQIDCHEAGQPLDHAPVTLADNRTWADRFQAELETRFGGDWGVLGEALETAADAAQETTQAVAAVVDAVRRYADPSLVGDVLQAAEILTSQAEALVRTPGDLYAAWADLVDPLVRAGHRAAGAAAGAVLMPEISATSSTLEQDRAVLARLVRGLAMAASSRALVDEVASGAVTTWDEALALLEAHSDLLRTVAEESEDPVVYRSAMDLLSQTDRAVRELAIALPHLRTWSPPRTMSVLELCQRVHADAAAGLVDSVLARNDIEEPGWVADDVLVVVEA